MRENGGTLRLRERGAGAKNGASKSAKRREMHMRMQSTARTSDAERRKRAMRWRAMNAERAHVGYLWYIKAEKVLRNGNPRKRAIKVIFMLRQRNALIRGACAEAYPIIARAQRGAATGNGLQKSSEKPRDTQSTICGRQRACAACKRLYKIVQKKVSRVHRPRNVTANTREFM